MMMMTMSLAGNMVPALCCSDMQGCRHHVHVLSCPALVFSKYAQQNGGHHAGASLR